MDATKKPAKTKQACAEADSIDKFAEAMKDRAASPDFLEKYPLEQNPTQQELLRDVVKELKSLNPDTPTRYADLAVLLMRLGMSYSWAHPLAIADAMYRKDALERNYPAQDCERVLAFANVMLQRMKKWQYYLSVKDSGASAEELWGKLLDELETPHHAKVFAWADAAILLMLLREARLSD